MDLYGLGIADQGKKEGLKRLNSESIESLTMNYIIDIY